jgi:hypothetical protein
MPHFRTHRPGRSPLAVLAYLAGFAGLLVIVSHFYLIPALKAAHNADPARRKVLAADAMLILAVVLFVLLLGLLITFRIGRFFRPRPPTPAKPTAYVDAWKESGRRMQTPEREE